MQRSRLLGIPLDTHLLLTDLEEALTLQEPLSGSLHIVPGRDHEGLEDATAGRLLLQAMLCSAWQRSSQRVGGSISRNRRGALIAGAAAISHLHLVFDRVYVHRQVGCRADDTP